MDSQLRVNAVYNDNMLMLPTKTDAYGSSVQPRFRAQVQTESWKSYADLDLHFDNYYNESDFDHDDQFLTLSTTNTGERYQFRLDANYNRNTTLTSEYTSSGVISNTRREEYELMPTWSY
ncbi:MAG: hypothetical protein GY814_17430, partial [Gammaproteobacteria bacterium]|nr:hypothetical protein [Gammaproteobacteria bacterium]